ncbi:hypothetical protein WS65_05530 [Burkholderia anthina]|nr:hypothetical protein WS65_05530 [Burkholderia anthina]
MRLDAVVFGRRGLLRMNQRFEPFASTDRRVDLRVSKASARIDLRVLLRSFETHADALAEPPTFLIQFVHQCLHPARPQI